MSSFFHLQDVSPSLSLEPVDTFFCSISFYYMGRELEQELEKAERQRDRKGKEVVSLTYKRKLEMMQEEVEKLLEAIKLLYKAILTILIILASLFLFIFNPSRFQRPKHITCATMPWSIWPALVILWGVCWMFHSPWSPLSAGIDYEELTNQVLYEFTAAPPLDPHIGNEFDVQHGQLWADDYELGQLGSSTTFQAPFTITGDAGLHSKGPSDLVTSDPQQQDAQLSSPLSLSRRHAAYENLSAVSEASPQGEQSKAPICCTELNCKTSSRTFKTDRELQRHINSIHKQTTSFACTVDGCDRGTQNPINRLDNFRRHMQRVHSQAGQILAIPVPETTPKGQKRQADTMSPLVSRPEKRHHRTEDAPVHTDVQGSPEPGVDQSVEVARLQRQLGDAIAKIDLLEKGIDTRNKLIMELLTERAKGSD
ncbi:hypothetical protein PFICI_04081 [Pestalotiopsis fici W106-1]|uniref:C2H2-type domain-containing protein n=1 Tax=Pestalotiopsis fici (strain W106-1 / CGMCC3.15140) TaxID=1229662 RepID=W3XLB0_PESFW|nr:uncharacterized protein PFICI_04081 [Pestalotiopsis fici W106-1]ETS86056.1 hypothetical protein PFICI_04081 [Pestalotiopsis fici W106-1]